MARARFYRIPTQIAWASAGSISQELSPLPFTLLGLVLVVRLDVTTSGTPAYYSDPFDRVISRLSLSGQVDNQSQQAFDFSNMILPYHDSRFKLKNFAPRRSTLADSLTNRLQQFAYRIHFGVRPILPDGSFNWYDLTAGLPPVQRGQLSLSGTFASGTNIMGAATTTTNDADVDVYAYGVQAEDGDPVEAWMPQAFPQFGMATPTPTATSSIFGTSYNLTSGDFIQSIMLMLRNGSNLPRTRDQLDSLRLYFQLENREAMTYGGRAGGTAGATAAAGWDYGIAEIHSQMNAGLSAAPYSDDAVNGTVGVPSLNSWTDAGLVEFPFDKFTSRVHPLYGIDTRKIATGDIRLDYGVLDATGTQLDILYKRYKLNSAHPANAAWA